MAMNDLQKLFFSFEGRITRSRFWYSFVSFSAAYFGLIYIWELIPAYYYISFDNVFIILPIKIALSILGLWVLLAIGVKRLHDRNRPGWFILAAFIPIINIWILIELGFLPGTVGANKFVPNIPITDI